MTAILRPGRAVCQSPGCSQGPTMGRYCITHWQASIGKPVELYRRPALDRPTVIAGTAPTSRAAAERAVLKSGSQRRRIYDALRAAPTGMTRDELEVHLGIPCNSLNPRLRELATDGWITDTGRIRLTRSGSPAVVWSACES